MLKTEQSVFIFLVFLACLFGCMKKGEGEPFKIGCNSVNLCTEDMLCVKEGGIVPAKDVSLFYANKPFRYIVYISKSACSVCHIKQMFKWDDIVERIGQAYTDYYFIISPEENMEIGELRFLMNQTYFSRPVFLDPNDSFLNENPDFRVETHPVVGILTDRRGTVLYAHNPFDDSPFIKDIRGIIHSFTY